MPKTPHWSLERIKFLVARDSFFLQKAKALDPLVAVFGNARNARSFVMGAIAHLTPHHFHKSIELTYDIADEYGITVDERGWYIKVYVDEAEPEVAFISFHPPARPMKTKAGMVRPTRRR